MEHHIIAEDECIFQAILRKSPTTGKCRYDVQISIYLRQAIEELMRRPIYGLTL